MSNSTFVYHFYNYDPSQAASSVAAVLFGVVTILHFLQLFHYRKWVITPLVIGGVIETVGYIARCISITNTKALAPYITQSIALLVPPIFFAATIYSLLSRIATFLNVQEALVIRPSRLTKTFVALDILSFLIQGGGAGYLSKGTLDAFNTGSLIVVGGLAVQLIGFSAFIVIAIIFHRRVHRIRHPGASRLMSALYITSAFILIRSIYRLIEFAQGNSGYLMSHEVLFYIFDSILMLLTMITYNLVHPGASLRHREGDSLMMKGSQMQRESAPGISPDSTTAIEITTKTDKIAEFDDNLVKFAAEGGVPLPEAKNTGHVDHDNARIWYTTYGQESGTAVILLHGSLGHSGNFGYQIPAFVESGFHVIAIDSRGHGRSTRDDRPFTYQFMASDVLAVMDTLRIDKASFLGWSDGAVISMCVAMKAPHRVNGVIFYACNVDPSGVYDTFDSPLLGRCFSRHSKDYAALSPTPDGFKQLAASMDQLMTTQPNFTKDDLSKINVPFIIMLSDKDEFIKMDHAKYLGDTIPDAKLVVLKDVTHFAPLQRPSYFNEIVLESLKEFA